MADKRPQVIFFDVYGTLAAFDPPRELIQPTAASQFGMTLDRAGIDRGYAAADQFLAQQNSSGAPLPFALCRFLAENPEFQTRMAIRAAPDRSIAWPGLAPCQGARRAA